MNEVPDISQYVTIDDAVLVGAGSYITRVRIIFLCDACGVLFCCSCHFPQSHSGKSMIVEKERIEALAKIVAKQVYTKPCPACGKKGIFTPITPNTMCFNSKEFLE